MRVVVAAVLALSGPGCGGCGDQPPLANDGALADADDVDAQPIDALLDAPPDAPPDAGIDAPPPMIDPECSGATPTCTTAPTTFVAIEPPTYYGHMIRLEDTLYVSTYDTVNQVVTAGRIVAADLVSGMQSTLLPGANSHVLSAARGWAYAAESGVASTSIWRFRPGVAPQALVTARPYVRTITADETHVYWAESGSAGTVVVRRAIAGGSIEPVMNCADAWRLVVDASYVYCAQFGQSIYRAPKAGTQPEASIAYSSYPFTEMIRCGSELFATKLGVQILYKIPTPFGPMSTFATTPELARALGVTATANHFLMAMYGVGVYRVDRTTAALQLIAPGANVEFSPVTWKGQLLFTARDLGVRRCVD